MFCQDIHSYNNLGAFAETSTFCSRDGVAVTVQRKRGVSHPEVNSPLLPQPLTPRSPISPH